MTACPPTFAFLFGVAIGFAVPKRAVHALGGLMRQRVNGWVHDHFLETVLILLVIAILGCGVAFLGLGYSMASNRAQTSALQRQVVSTKAEFAHYRACVNAYAHKSHVSQVARTLAAQRLDDARSRVESDSRRLWSLIAQSVGGRKVAPSVAKKALGIYLADSAAEQRLHQQLTEARLRNPIPDAPNRACP